MLKFQVNYHMSWEWGMTKSLTRFQSTNTIALVHIFLGASSLINGSNWKQTQIPAVTLAKAVSMTSNLDVVISYMEVFNMITM